MTTGLVLAAFGLGLRHGIDLDHIAAIADLTSSAPGRRRGFVLSMIYAVGHALVVLALGAALILVGASIPPGLDAVMARVTGLTLIALGLWVGIELVRHGRGFRLRSRWSLLARGAAAGLHRVTASVRPRSHPHAGHGGSPADASGDGSVAGDAMGLRGATLTEERPAEGPVAGTGAAAGIGMIHGVGVESPTQIAVFVAASAATGAVGGLALLVSWVIGLVVANAGLAVLAGIGLLNAERNFWLAAGLAAVISIGSIALGASLLLAPA